MAKKRSEKPKPDKAAETAADPADISANIGNPPPPASIDRSASRGVTNLHLKETERLTEETFDMTPNTP
ncbi:MAG: hypothetical protein AAFP69_20085, partial [Planctomycetota bacterium]